MAGPMAGRLERVRARRHLHFFKDFQEVALIVIAVCVVVPKSLAQRDLLGYSIDCGNTRLNYTDRNGLEWIADDGTYIKTGNSSDQLFLESSIDDNPALRSFRFFPEPRRAKYCYELPTVDPIKLSYLFRASFYMNESVLKAARPFEFIISIDGTEWFTLTSGDDSQTSLLIVQEGIFHRPNGVTFFCLRPVVGVPFISSLEVRALLKYTMYAYNSWETQYLALIARYNAGANSTAPDVRYPDDVFDRIWKTPEASLTDAIPRISISEANYRQPLHDPNFIPFKVMQDAWLLQQASSVNNTLSSPSIVTFNTYKSGPQVRLDRAGRYLLVYVYAQDLNTTVSKFQNIFNVILSSHATDVPASLHLSDYFGAGGPYNFTSTDITTVQSPFFFYGSNFINVSLSWCPHPSSTISAPCEVVDQGRLPSINAIEIYAQYDYNFSMTNQDDDQIITVLKTVFSLSDWQGDPCVPEPHDWLSCTLSLPERFSRYFLTAINLSNNRIFSGFVNVTTTTGLVLNSLSEMSVTNSQVDDPTFQLLTNYAGPALSVLDMSYNTLTSLPTTWENSTRSLRVLDLSHNQLQGQVSSLDTWVQRNSWSLQKLYINNNNLTGIFSSPLYFSSLPNLTIANFDHNSIEGTLDLSIWYAALQELSKNTAATKVGTPAAIVQLFSFVNNSISDIIPNVDTFGSSVQDLLSQNQPLGILLGGNPYCNNAKSYIHRYICRSTVNDDVKRDIKRNNEALIIGTSTGAAIVLAITSVFSVILWRLWKQVLTLREIQKALAERKVQPPFYQYSDLKSATRDFHNACKLGSGGFGVVYKGVLTDQTSVAVKKLFHSQSTQVLDDFLNEVVLITGIKHRNLVQLKGCCIQDKQRILVYDYAEKGNLAEALWGSKAHELLSWEIRLEVCLGVARGLAYLHEELQPSILHRDIKPENILLGRNFQPKVADFGLARLFHPKTSEADYTQISRVAGTKGYLAPEYALHGQLSSKADVYSYGILVLEVICRRKCIDFSLPVEEQVLKDWVRSKRSEGLLCDVLQPDLQHNCTEVKVLRAIDIGLLCSQFYPEKRPSMSQVVAMFLGRMDVEVLDEFDQFLLRLENGGMASGNHTLECSS